MKDRTGEVWERECARRSGTELFVVTSSEPGAHRIVWLESGKPSRMDEGKAGWEVSERMKRLA